MVDSNSIGQASSAGGATPLSTDTTQQSPSGNPTPMNTNQNVGSMGLKEFQEQYPEIAKQMEEQMVWEMGKKQEQSLKRMKEERKKSEQGG